MTTCLRLNLIYKYLKANKTNVYLHMYEHKYYKLKLNATYYLFIPIHNTIDTLHIEDVFPCHYVKKYMSMIYYRARCTYYLFVLNICYQHLIRVVYLKVWPIMVSTVVKSTKYKIYCYHLNDMVPAYLDFISQYDAVDCSWCNELKLYYLWALNC